MFPFGLLYFYFYRQLISNKNKFSKSKYRLNIKAINKNAVMYNSLEYVGYNYSIYCTILEQYNTINTSIITI